MQQRIDHATVITCRQGLPTVLVDTSVAFDDGVITRVCSTSEVGESPQWKPPRPPVSELRGRPLGAILIKAGLLTAEQLLKALELQKAKHAVIGQTLVELGYVSESDVDWAMAAQAGRESA